jgi:peptidoglycan hydrolase-like protein with peptidoglycan-binding domain|tara:strand:- start:1980 stop:3032 length:1053 start_codon:yes stop_codon:yes gene_type:complete
MTMQRVRDIRSIAVFGVGAVAVTTLAAAAFLVLNDSGATTAEDVPIGYSTVEVQQRDLTVDHEAVGSIEPLNALVVASPTSGTVIETLRPGATVSAGSIIATVDDRVVVAIDGATPMYRDLTVGDVGPDVAQLEAALVGFGLDPDVNVTVDDEFTAATASMVRDWQATIGIVESGVVRASNIVALPEPMRVTNVIGSMGTQVAEGDPIVALATHDQVVNALVPIVDATTLAAGAAVVLRLPDRTELDGTVHAVTLGTDATVRSVVITFDDPGLVPSLDGVTIDISWTDVVVEDAPTLPADVFRHLDSGIYVVDILAADGTTSAVQVQPGMVLGGLVEVSGVPAGAAVIRP